MTAVVPCPGRCGGAIHFKVSGVLAGSATDLAVTIDPFDLRRHSGCLSPHGGGERLVA